MKRLFIIQDSLTNKISFWHIVLFAVSLPFDRFYSELILISFAIHTLIHFRKERIKRLPVKEVLLLQGVFFLTLVASLYSVNPSGVVKEWEKQLAIFLFPLLFALTAFDFKKYRTHFLIAFAAACTITIAYLEFDAIRIIRYNHLTYAALFSNAFINHNFSDPIDIHPTYLSMYVALSIAIMLSFLSTPGFAWSKTAIGVCMILLSISLLQLGSKSVLFATLLLVLLAPFFLTIVAKNKKLLLIAALMLTVIAVTVLRVDSLKKRFVTELKNDLTKQEAGKTKNEYRLVRWQAATDLIRQSPVFGFGTASEMPLLKKKYFERKLYNSFINELNVHNQYLSFMIKAGCIGLLLFLFTLYSGFNSAIKRKDFILFSFLIILAVVSLSENILEVNKGIFFYSFFFCLFVFSAPRQPDVLKIATQSGKRIKRSYNKKTMAVS